MKRKIVIIGAGSAVFTQGLVADMILIGGEWDIHLVDVSPDNLAVAESVVRRMIALKQAPITLTATTDRRQALPQADVVVSTFGVGGRRAWEQDVFIPRQRGIFQPVGDSVMPGGISRAMRQIPVAVGIALDAEELCPNALVINYANPMTAIAYAMRKVSSLNVLGLCHGVNHVQGYLASWRASPQRAVAHGYRRQPLHVDHRRPPSRPIALAALAGHRRESAQLPDPESPFSEAAPFSWELYRTHGAFPVMDRHVTEFTPPLPQAYYGRTLGVNAYSLEGTIRAGDGPSPRWPQSPAASSRSTRRSSSTRRASTSSW